MPSRRTVSVPLAAPVRSNYFTGRLLSAEDLSREQEYHRSARRRLNLLALGAGVAGGLAVSSSGDGVVVSPGVAIDRLGREVVVPEPVRLAPAARGRVFVLLAYAEELIDPVPALDPGAPCGSVRFGAVRETYRLWLSSSRPSPSDPDGSVIVGVVGRRRTPAPGAGPRRTARRRRPSVRARPRGGGVR